jgi:tetratricopeptide (TPR) repeat protein
LPVLTAGSRELPARQQTLRATLAWSYELLAPDEQRLFARLGVFVGGFDIEAAEVICSDDGDLGLGVVTGLEALGRQSLLPRLTESSGGVRYVMLETVREYAAERLAAGEDGAAIRRRHAEHFLSLAEAGDASIAGPTGGAWIARLAAEHDNLRAALGWFDDEAEIESASELAASLWRFWLVQGHLTEGRGWLERLLSRRSGPPTVARGRALVGAGALALRQYDTAAAWRWLDEAVHVCRTVGDPAGLATALKHLGLIALYETPPDYALAVERFEESLILRKGLNDLDGAASCLNDLANVAIEQGDYERADRLLEESLELCRVLDNRYGLGFVLHNLSLVALEVDDEDRAALLLGECLGLADELGSRERIGCELWAVGCVAAARGRSARAATLFGGAEALREDVGAEFSPAELATLERKIAPARARLGPSAWDAAVAAGRDLPIEDLIAEARAEIASSRSEDAAIS